MHRSTMSVPLEPSYLANILLHTDNVATNKAFTFVSKNCKVALLALKVNPAAFSDSPRDIVKFFPNINTMVVDELSCLQKTHPPRHPHCLCSVANQMLTNTIQCLNVSWETIKLQ